MLAGLRKILFWAANNFRGNSKISFFSRYTNSRYISLGENVTIGTGTVLFPIRNGGGVSYDARIEIADSVYIGHQTQLHSIGHMKIGRGSVLSDYVYLSDVAHGLSPVKGPIMQQPLESKGPVIIGENCFIGYGVAILPGVELGNSCVVSARAVVTKSFPPFTMLAGSPAKVIKKFDFATEKWVSA